MAMLGDIVELSVVVRDLDAAAARFTRLFGLSVHRRDISERFGFKNAILPTGIGHIELLQRPIPERPSASSWRSVGRASTWSASNAPTSRGPW
jgi:catechol 2,3-dioxygenase-like lactoylglutathione lyase family enzyme